MGFSCNRLSTLLTFFLSLVPPTLAAALYKRDDHSSTWQVLADGTQDLAALVGLFATDSVERYSVDYSRGYLGVAVAPGSMLGILGYVRALVKLAMGSEACVSAAFPTAPVRALLGVPEEDRLPGEELVTVKYVQRSVQGEDIVWTKMKSVAHTKESMPSTWAHTAMGRDRKPQILLLEAGRKSKQLLSRQRPPHQWHVFLAILAATALNSFAVLLIGGGWPWSKFVASIVTFFFLASSSMMWAFVYMKEQVPLFSNDSILWLDKNGEIHPRPCGSVSLRTNQNPVAFAILESAGSYVLLPCSTPTNRQSLALRLFSGFSAAAITLGYLCQYIVVRRSTRGESLRWLLIQSGLTLLRVFVWVFPSSLIPKIFDQKSFLYGHLQRPGLTDFQSSSGTLFGSQFNDYRTIQELELAVTFNSAGVGLEELRIPGDVLTALNNINLVDACDSLLKLETDWVQKVKVALKSGASSWMIPPLLFRKILLQRSFDNELANIEYSDEHLVGDWTCLVLNLAKDKSWKDSEPVLLPVVQLTYRIDLLDENGKEAGKPLVQKGFCTCLSVDTPTFNLVQPLGDEDAWVPFNEILQAPLGLAWSNASHFRIVLETGEAGDASIDSELTVDGYTLRWPPFRHMIEEAMSLQRLSQRDGPERSLVDFNKDSRLLDETLRPNVVKATQGVKPRQPEFKRFGKNKDAVIQIPRGGPLTTDAVVEKRERKED